MQVCNFTKYDFLWMYFSKLSTANSSDNFQNISKIFFWRTSQLQTKEWGNIRSEYNFFWWLFDRDNVTSAKMKFRPGIRQNFFCEKNQDIKSLCGSSNGLELRYLDKYQTYVRTCPSASKRTSVVLKKHSVAYSLTFFT